MSTDQPRISSAEPANTPSVAALQLPASPLLTEQQQQAQTIAIGLRNHAAIAIARDQAIAQFAATPVANLDDGKATLTDAVDELIHAALLVASTGDPAHPAIVWYEHLPYHDGVQALPGARYAGDDPDRIYRSSNTDSAYRYEIRGVRHHTYPPLDFTFEALAENAWGASAVVNGADLDIATDGTFTITVDASAANGRKNHLQLPPGKSSILIRDTLVDWKNELPNTLSIHRIDDTPTPPVLTAEARVQHAVKDINAKVDTLLNFLANKVWNNPANQLNAFERTLSWGVPGGVLAISRFKLTDKQALVIHLDPIGARYLGIQVTDLWLRSAPYAGRSTSLSNAQIKANSDGTITYVLSATDPGHHNWLDSGGLGEGVIQVRWELLPSPAFVDKAVRDVNVVSLDQLAELLGSNALAVDKRERQQLLQAREASYGLRLTGR